VAKGSRADQRYNHAVPVSHMASHLSHDLAAMPHLILGIGEVEKKETKCPFGPAAEALQQACCVGKV
jgi:hypothetical protein